MTFFGFRASPRVPSCRPRGASLFAGRILRQGRNGLLPRRLSLSSPRLHVLPSPPVPATSTACRIRLQPGPSASRLSPSLYRFCRARDPEVCHPFSGAKALTASCSGTSRRSRRGFRARFCTEPLILCYSPI